MRSETAGFTLLEVLIAFVILALGLAVLFRGMASSLRATSLAGRYEQGLSRAQSHLDAIAAPGVAIAPRTEAGSDGNGFAWKLTVRPLATASAVRQRSAASVGPRLTLYAATVTESWSGGAGQGAVTLGTQLIGPPPP